MLNIGVLLCSSLIQDGLSTLLTEGGFSTFLEPNLPDDVEAVIVDFADCHDPQRLRIYEESGTKIVALARGDDDLELSDEGIASLSGILTYGLSGDAFVRSLRLICSGERLFPTTLERSRPAQPNDNALRAAGARLSPREREVLLHLVDGHSNKGIARILGMSEATVKVHLKNVLRKIRVDNRTQAAIWAVANLSAPVTRLAA
jgi:two-component system nitrate/nitrite response regulator NarL